VTTFVSPHAICRHDQASTTGDERIVGELRIETHAFLQQGTLPQIAYFKEDISSPNSAGHFTCYRRRSGFRLTR
jgi:hypothetical protein